MTAPTLQLIHVSSWHAQGHIYLYELNIRNSFVPSTLQQVGENTELNQQRYE
jgi:hypothetical protein